MKKLSVHSDEDTCPENEVQSHCANCETTCSIRVKDPDCDCEPGCVCDYGYLRNSEGTCVQESECGNVYLSYTNQIFLFIYQY